MDLDIWMCFFGVSKIDEFQANAPREFFGYYTYLYSKQWLVKRKFCEVQNFLTDPVLFC